MPKEWFWTGFHPSYLKIWLPITFLLIFFFIPFGFFSSCVYLYNMLAGDPKRFNMRKKALKNSSQKKVIFIWFLRFQESLFPEVVKYRLMALFHLSKPLENFLKIHWHGKSERAFKKNDFFGHLRALWRKKSGCDRISLKGEDITDREGSHKIQALTMVFFPKNLV